MVSDFPLQLTLRNYHLLSLLVTNKSIQKPCLGQHWAAGKAGQAALAINMHPARASCFVSAPDQELSLSPVLWWKKQGRPASLNAEPCQDWMELLLCSSPISEGDISSIHFQNTFSRALGNVKSPQPARAERWSWGMLRKSTSPLMVDLPVPAGSWKKPVSREEKIWSLLLKTLVWSSFPNLFVIFYCESTEIRGITVLSLLLPQKRVESRASFCSLWKFYISLPWHLCPMPGFVCLFLTLVLWIPSI